MKVSKAIERAAAVYPELAADERCFLWLSEIEERIAVELALEKYEKITSSSNDRELIAPEYLSDVYPLYLIMKADLSNSDHSRYVCHNSAFCSSYVQVANYFIRERQLTENIRFSF